MQHTVRLLVGDAHAALAAMGHAGGALPMAAPAPGSVLLPLTAHESAIFGVLREVGASAGTEVRVAGGWVRDKLVGRDSHDIDVCVDTVSGADFAAHVNAFLAARGDATSTVGVIHANPDQSKHLETATVRVLGSWVDFVGLRAEVYEGDSRIPRVSAGTPVQDAMRRDFTLNAMFYNISQDCVEDFTGLGFADLASGTLRTPLPPLLTFRDDPLRVLRAVRFSARFGMALDAALIAAARDAAVSADLVAKVSRERVGIEMDKMLGEGASPPAALRTLRALGLHAVAWASPLSAEAQLGGCLALPPHCAHLLPPALLAAAAPDALAATAPAPGLAALPPQWLDLGLQVMEGLVYAAEALGPGGAAALVCRGGGGASAAPAPALAEGGSSSSSSSGSGMVEEAAKPLDTLDFSPPSTFPRPFPQQLQPDMRPALPCHATRVLDGVLCSADERRLLFYAAQLFPLASAHRCNAKNSRTEPLAAVLLLEGLKRKRKDSDDVAALHRGALGFLQLLQDPAFAQELRSAPTPPPHATPACAAHALALGNVLRKDAKELWRPALLLSLAASLCAHIGEGRVAEEGGAGAGGGSGRGGSSGGSSGGSALAEQSAQAVGALLRAHHAIALRVVGPWGLEGCWAWKPKLDGRELKSEVSASMVGPAVGAIIEKQLAWQLINPQGTRQECVAYLKSL